jgi:peptidoglycan/xylan/chitin deacetylase (PgdA/CDA1 family)
MTIASRIVVPAALSAAVAVASAGCVSGSKPRPPAAATSPRPRPARTAPPNDTVGRTAPASPRPVRPARAAPTSPSRKLVGQIPDQLPTRRRVVALTFDAGADDAGAPRILATLQSRHATATFFMTGRWAQLYPRWARRIAARYPVGNHTYDHTDLLGLSLRAVRREILTAQSAIAAISRRSPTRLFRFPYGSSSPSTLGTANQLGYTAVGWTVDTLGWEGTSSGQSVATVIQRALSHLEPGEIVLMHVGANPNDHSTLDADALAMIIHDIRRRGYAFVALPEYL